MCNISDHSRINLLSFASLLHKNSLEHSLQKTTNFQKIIYSEKIYSSSRDLSFRFSILQVRVIEANHSHSILFNKLHLKGASSIQYKRFLELHFTVYLFEKLDSIDFSFYSYSFDYWLKPAHANLLLIITRTIWLHGVSICSIYFDLFIVLILVLIIVLENKLYCDLVFFPQRRVV